MSFKFIRNEKNHIRESQQTQERRPRHIVFFLSMAFMSMSLWAATPKVAEYKVSATEFLQNYMIYSLENHYKMSSEFAIPVIWVFSPDGKMVGQATDDASLAQLRKNFLSKNKMTALPGMPDASIVEGVLEKMEAGKHVVPKPSVIRKPILVFIGIDNPSCDHCAEFAKTFYAMSKARNDDVHAIHVLMTD